MEMAEEQQKQWIRNMADSMRKQDELENGLLCEMAKVADFNGYRLVIWTNDEGEIPHFHIMTGKNPNNPEFDSCIKFNVSEYYPHGGKHTDKLPHNQLKNLIGLLNSQDPYTSDTVWKILLAEWNRNDNRVKIPMDTPMPDYRHIVYPSK